MNGTVNITPIFTQWNWISHWVEVYVNLTDQFTVKWMKSEFHHIIVEFMVFLSLSVASQHPWVGCWCMEVMCTLAQWWLHCCQLVGLIAMGLHSPYVSLPSPPSPLVTCVPGMSCLSQPYHPPQLLSISEAEGLKGSVNHPESWSKPVDHGLVWTNILVIIATIVTSGAQADAFDWWWAVLGKHKTEWVLSNIKQWMLDVGHQ